MVVGNIDPYGQVWRTGANTATRITFSTPVNFGGTEVPAGTYELFAIPDETEWTVILNKAANQWGAYSYDPRTTSSASPPRRSSSPSRSRPSRSTSTTFATSRPRST